MKTLKAPLPIITITAAATVVTALAIAACDDGFYDTPSQEARTAAAWTGVSPHLTHDDQGRVTEEAWFTADGAPTVGPMDWHRVEYIRDDRGLVIEQVGYDVADEPAASIILGYAVALRSYDEEGRQVSVAYYGPGDEPVRMGSIPGSDFIYIASEGGHGYHAARTSYLDDGTVVHAYFDKRGLPMESAADCAWIARRALEDQERFIELCGRLDVPEEITTRDERTNPDGSMTVVHCTAFGDDAHEDTTCSVVELDADGEFVSRSDIERPPVRYAQLGAVGQEDGPTGTCVTFLERSIGDVEVHESTFPCATLLGDEDASPFGCERFTEDPLEGDTLLDVERRTFAAIIDAIAKEDAQEDPPCEQDPECCELLPRCRTEMAGCYVSQRDEQGIAIDWTCDFSGGGASAQEPTQEPTNEDLDEEVDEDWMNSPCGMFFEEDALDPPADAIEETEADEAPAQGGDEEEILCFGDSYEWCIERDLVTEDELRKLHDASPEELEELMDELIPECGCDEDDADDEGFEDHEPIEDAETELDGVGLMAEDDDEYVCFGADGEYCMWRDVLTDADLEGLLGASEEELEALFTMEEDGC